MENENNRLPLEENVSPEVEAEETEVILPDSGEVEVPVEETPEEMPAGEENPEAVPAEEETPAEIKQGIRMTPGKLTALIAAVVVITAVVIALILSGMGLIGNSAANDAAATEGMEDIVPATIPADGNPDDATCKGSYTVSDEEVASAADTVVATIGDDRLTNSDLQIYYWMHVQQYLNQNADYLAYFGLDYTQPLDTQLCPMGETQMTWQQFFLDGALKNWQNYQSLANESLAQGYEISPEIRADLDGMAESMNADAQAYGFADAEEYLAYNVGRGSSVESYVRYLVVLELLSSK